ncbi:12146_t:CDS:2 [Gigaspora rosea]|nr:12146_t:CDS:2 [Gigaspora rosea]
MANISFANTKSRYLHLQYLKILGRFPLPNDTDIRVKRLKKENIKAQLETCGILKDMNINRKELVKELELVLAKETLEKTLDI